MVIQLAKPLEDARIKKQQAQYAPRPTAVQPQGPGVMETIASTAGQSAAGKLGEAAAGKLMSGSLFGPGMSSQAAALASKTGAAATGGMGALGALGTAVPYVGLGLLAGKAFGLFNHGGMVPEIMMGPLSKIRYKRGGGEVSEEIEVTYGPLAKGA